MSNKTPNVKKIKNKTKLQVFRKNQFKVLPETNNSQNFHPTKPGVTFLQQVFQFLINASQNCFHFNYTFCYINLDYYFFLTLHLVEKTVSRLCNLYVDHRRNAISLQGLVHNVFFLLFSPSK